MYEKYKYAGIVLEIEQNTHIVIDVEFTVITDLTKKFLRKIFIGYDLTQGLDELIRLVKKHYLAPSQQAIIVAMEAAVQRYWNSVS